MTEGINPAAPHHIPSYIPGPDGSDPLFTIVVVFLLVMFLAAGVIYFKLHSLPEHMGEKQNSAQLQIISILAVLALFTHNNLFWVLALLLAVFRVPDFLSPLEAIAKSLEKMAANSKSENPGAPNFATDLKTTEEAQPADSVPDDTPTSGQTGNKED